MTISLKQIRYFVTTAERGQISQAAIELSISQSAVTTAIKQLESTIGTSLFVRSQKGMELTEGGIQFLYHAYEILDKLNEAKTLNILTDSLEGSLSVAATYTVIGYVLPNHLEKLKTVFPHLDVHLFEHNRETIEEGLLSNRYDIAVLLTANVLDPGIVTETLVSSTRRLWVSARHPLLELDEVGFKEVSKEPYIMLTVDEAAHTTLKYWSNTAYQPSVALRTSSVEAVRSMVANNQGVAVLSDMVHRPWSLEGKRIATIVVNDSVPPMDVGLAWRKGVEFTPAMEAFRSYFRNAYQIPSRIKN